MSNLLLEDSNEKCPLDEYSNDHQLEWDFPSNESTDQCSQSSCLNHALFFVRFHVVCQKSAPVCSSKLPFRVFSLNILHFELKSPFQVFGLSSSFCSFCFSFIFFHHFFVLFFFFFFFMVLQRPFNMLLMGRIRDLSKLITFCPDEPEGYSLILFHTSYILCPIFLNQILEC